MSLITDPEFARLISAAGRKGKAVWMDGSEAACLLASSVRLPAYCTDGWDISTACAMDRLFPIKRVYTDSVNEALVSDVLAIIGDTSEEGFSHAYMALLVGAAAAHDGLDVLLSPTGSEAALCSSPRVAAAFDELDSDDHFHIRRAAWGIKDPIERYERLIAGPVSLKSGSVLDRIQATEFARCLGLAMLESKAASAFGVTVRHPFLAAATRRYVLALPETVRYSRKPLEMKE